MKMILTAILLALSAGIASAENITAQRFGNTTYYNGSNGYNATAQQFGNTTYYHDSNGNMGTAQQFGGTTYYHDTYRPNR